MSGIVNRIRLDKVREERVDWNIHLGNVLPAGHTLYSTVSLTENGTPLVVFPGLQDRLINPGPLGPNQNVYMVTQGLTPSTTYYIRVWHEDDANPGVVLGEAGRWVTTFPDGSVSNVDDPYVSCGFQLETGQEQVSWGYNDNGYGHRFRSETVAQPEGGNLGEEVA